MRSQFTYQTQFLSWVVGDPIEYSGNDMQSAHAHFDIALSDIDVIAAPLSRAALVEFADERARLAQSMNRGSRSRQS